jgi:Tfp pilus assembly protein PilX
MNRGRRPPARRQRGLAMFIVLIIMAVLAMLSVSAYEASTSNVRIAGNMAVRQEAVSAAQSVIETTISTTQFTSDPAAVAAATYPVDVGGDGVPDYTVRIAPAPNCYRARVLKAGELDVTVKADAACMTSSVSANAGIDSASIASSGGDSLCADTEWNVRATVSDGATGANVAIDQGVSVRALSSDAQALCTG